MRTCPKCDGVRVSDGEVSLASCLFRPGPLRSFTVAPAAGLSPSSTQFFACLDCGLLWGQLDPQELAEFIARHCTAAVIERWGVQAKTGDEAAAAS